MKTRNNTWLLVALFVVAGVGPLMSRPALAGVLQPTAPPGPTMRTLDEIYNKIGGSLAMGGATSQSGSTTPWVLVPNMTVASMIIPEAPGSSGLQGREGSSDVYGYSGGVVVPTSETTGGVTGARQHRPMSILKPIDKASPLLFKAACTGQTFRNVTLNFYRVDPTTRTDTLYFIVTLTEAVVVEYALTPLATETAQGLGNAAQGERISFVYNSIQLNWVPDAIVESDMVRRTAAAKSEPADAATPAATQK